MVIKASLLVYFLREAPVGVENINFIPDISVCKNKKFVTILFGKFTEQMRSVLFGKKRCNFAKGFKGK